jgi:thioredoxin-related protein
MKQLYFAISTIVLLLFISVNAHAQQPKSLVWFLDYKEVTKFAEDENKPILLFFQGSDWCEKGIEMQKEVFGNEQFVIYATKRILCLYVDFPSKNKLSMEQNRHNAKLRKEFNIPADYTKGFPTVVIVSKSGKVLLQETGYNGQGPQSLISKINLILKAVGN